MDSGSAGANLAHHAPAKGIGRSVWDSALDIPNIATPAAAATSSVGTTLPAEPIQNASLAIESGPAQQHVTLHQENVAKIVHTNQEPESELPLDSDELDPLDRLLGTARRAIASNLVPLAVRHAIGEKLRSRLLAELEEGELAPPPPEASSSAVQDIGLYRYPLTAATDLADMSAVLETTKTRRPPRPVIQIVLRPTVPTSSTRARYSLKRGNVLGPWSYMAHLYLPPDLVPPPPPFTSLPAVPPSATSATRPAAPSVSTTIYAAGLDPAPATLAATRLDSQTRYTYRSSDAQTHQAASTQSAQHSSHAQNQRENPLCTSSYPQRDSQPLHSRWPHDGNHGQHHFGPSHSQHHFYQPGAYYGYYPPSHPAYYQHPSAYYWPNGPAHPIGQQFFAQAEAMLPEYRIQDNGAMPLSDCMDLDCEPVSAPVFHPPHFAASRSLPAAPANAIERSTKALRDLLAAKPPKPAPSASLGLPSKPVLEMRSVHANEFVEARVKAVPPWCAAGAAGAANAPTSAKGFRQSAPANPKGVVDMDVDLKPLGLANHKKRTLKETKGAAASQEPQEQVSPPMRQKRVKKDSQQQVAGGESAQGVFDGDAASLFAATPVSRAKQAKRKRLESSPQSELEEGEVDTSKPAKKKKQKRASVAADASATPSKPSTRTSKAATESSQVEERVAEPGHCDPPALPIPPTAWVARIRRRNDFFASIMKPVDVAKGASVLLRLTLLKKMSPDDFPVVADESGSIPPMPMSYSRQMVVINQSSSDSVAAETATVASRGREDSNSAETELPAPMQETPKLADEDVEMDSHEQQQEPTTVAASEAASSSVSAVKAEARRRRNKAARLRAKQARPIQGPPSRLLSFPEEEVETTSADAPDVQEASRAGCTPW